MTTSRKLYEYLELAKGQFSRWAKTNILENPFAEENVDYEGVDINVEGNKTVDYRLTANFAKKLSMQGKTERAEQAGEYFIKVEDKLKEVVVNKDSVNDSTLKNKKQHPEQFQTNKGKHYTSSTQRLIVDCNISQTIK